MTKAAKAIPDGYHTLTPMLTQDDSKKAIAWYKQAFGAEALYMSLDPSGRVMHAEVRIGNSRVMVHDVMEGGKGPKEFGGSPSGLWIYTEDCDALFSRAVAAGATVGMPMTDMFWGDRFGFVTDPFGYGWAIATHKQDLTQQEIEEGAKNAFATQNR